MVKPFTIRRADLALKFRRLFPDGIEQAGALGHRPLGGGNRVVVFTAKEFLKEHFGAIFRSNRRVIFAPGQRHRDGSAKAGLAHRAKHQRRKARGTAVMDGQLLIDGRQCLGVTSRVDASKQAAARPMPASEGLKPGHQRAVILERRERRQGRGERVILPGVHWREASRFHAKPPIGEHRPAWNLMRRHRPGGRDVVRVGAHDFQPGQGNGNAQAFKKRATWHAPMVGIDIHRECFARGCLVSETMPETPAGTIPYG